MNRNILMGATFTLSLALGACTTRDTRQPAADSATSRETASAAAASASNAAEPNVVTVHAKDFAFDGPAQIPSGMTTFRLVNDGQALHHLMLVRLDSGRTVPDLLKALGAGPNAAPPRWMVPIGGPNAPDPSHESNATLDMQPGNYAMICVIDVPGGVPHVMKGMSRALTVVPATTTASAAAPAADVTITLSDYAFDFSKPLTAGTHTFEVKNTAAQPHEAFLARLAPGKTAQDLLGWIAKPNGPPPGSAVGGITPIGAGTVYFTTDLEAGNYVLICFVPDAKDGKPHFVHGMVKSFAVT